MRAGAVLFLTLLSFAPVRAQEPGFLRCGPFTNQIQIPTLVLDDRGRAVEEATHPKFLVSLDGGKPRPAAHVRLEGDDPLALAIVLDTSVGESFPLADPQLKNDPNAFSGQSLSVPVPDP